MFLDEIIAVPKGEGEVEALKGELPVVVYGDGWYAPYVRAFLGRAGVRVAGTFVDDGFTATAGTVSFDEIRKRFGKFNIVIGFANSRMAREKLGKKDPGQVAGIYFFDVMGALLDNHVDRVYVERHREQLGLVHDMLADELSKKTYAAFLGAKLSGATDGLYEVLRKDQYFPEGVIGLTEREVFADGGAYTGDTMLTFMRKTNGKYGKYYAFEPEPANAAGLSAKAGKRGLRDVCVIAKGLWSKADTLRFSAAQGTTGSAISGTGAASIEVDTIDNLAADATYIKMDVEGAELEALKGAAGTIKRNRPKLAICLYHKPGDLFEIPLFIKSLVPEYRFFLRQHQPVSCELVLYAVI